MPRSATRGTRDVRIDDRAARSARSSRPATSHDGHHPTGQDRCFAFDQFGPLSIRPCHGSTWAPEKKPTRLPATYTRTHAIRYFHGCYSLGDDRRTLIGFPRPRRTI
jgi:hypothetical protein